MKPLDGVNNLRNVKEYGIVSVRGIPVLVGGK